MGLVLRLAVGECVRLDLGDGRSVYVALGRKEKPTRLRFVAPPEVRISREPWPDDGATRTRRTEDMDAVTVYAGLYERHIAVTVPWPGAPTVRVALLSAGQARALARRLLDLAADLEHGREPAGRPGQPGEGVE